MKTLGIVAVAAAGLGYFLYTDRGRELMSRAGECVRDNYEQLRERIRGEQPVEGLIHEAVESSHPDTAMARAFEQAVG
ncbi:MAG: hypothetical protein ACK47B_07870 [Armatimonadota bacterium]